MLIVARKPPTLNDDEESIHFCYPKIYPIKVEERSRHQPLKLPFPKLAGKSLEALCGKADVGTWERGGRGGGGGGEDVPHF